MKLRFAAKENQETGEAFLETINPMSPDFAGKAVAVLRNQCEEIHCPVFSRNCAPAMSVEANREKTTARIIVRNQMEKFYIARDGEIHIREVEPDRVTTYWGGYHGKVGRTCPLPTTPEIGV